MRSEHPSQETPRLDPEPPDSDLPRFGPTDRAPGTLPSPSWEPGVVEVQFRQGIRPDLGPTGAREAPGEIPSAEGVDLTELNRILQQYGLQRAELTFQTTPDQALASIFHERHRGAC